MRAEEWLRAERLYAVVCRPALPKDTADMLDMTARIWGENDYLRRAWQDWLIDPQGFLAAAEYGGRVVGVCRLARMGVDEWWMQGMRIDPDYQGRRIGSHLHDYLLDHWQRTAAGTVRLATSAKRVPVHRMCERTGFHKVSEYMAYRAAALDEPVGSFELVKVEESEAATRFALDSAMMAYLHGLIDLNWLWAELNVQRVEDAVGRQAAYWWQADPDSERGLLLIEEDEEDGERYLAIQAVACQVEQLAALLLDYRRLAGRLGCPNVYWVAPDDPQLRSALSDAGFESDWDNNLYLFEKRAGQDP